MKKTLIILAVILLLLATVLWGGSAVRSARYRHGWEDGYSAGYSAALTDKSNGEKHDSQILASGQNPYPFGDSNWKGYMMGFPSGYSDGYNGWTYSPSR